MAEELVELTAAIQHELELARSGDGYEEAAVAGEIVERMVAPMLAARDASFEQRLSDVQVEYRKSLESWDRSRKRLDGDRALLRWLHAEAAHWLEFQNAAAESAEEDNDRLRMENKRLRRGVEFEAHGTNPSQNDGVSFRAEDFGLDVDTDAGIYISLNHRPAVRTVAWGDDVNVDYDADGIPTGVEVLRSLASRPQCAVHPETRGEGEECSGCDVTGQASREEAADETVGTGYPQGSGPGDGSATPAPPSFRQRRGAGCARDHGRYPCEDCGAMPGHCFPSCPEPTDPCPIVSVHPEGGTA